VTGLRGPLPVGFIPDACDHLVQLATGDGVFKYAMQPSCSTASFAAMFNVLDLLPKYTHS
jgi:hypothetical protein